MSEWNLPTSAGISMNTARGGFYVGDKFNVPST